MIQTMANDSLAFALRYVLREAVLMTLTSTLLKLAVSIHRTGVTDSNGDWGEDIVIGMGGVSERG